MGWLAKRKEEKDKEKKSSKAKRAAESKQAKEADEDVTDDAEEERQASGDVDVIHIDMDEEGGKVEKEKKQVGKGPATSEEMSLSDVTHSDNVQKEEEKKME